jgi:ribosomal protein S6
MQKNGQSEVEADAGLYEVGFLLMGTITEDAAAADFDAVSNIVTKFGASIKASEAPALRTLTYTITKQATGKNVRFDTAYFGSIIFEAPTDSISTLRGEIEKLPNLLRALVIEIGPEALMPRERRVMGKIDAEKFRPEKSDVVVTPISEEELDKKIEQMVVE